MTWIKHKLQLQSITFLIGWFLVCGSIIFTNQSKAVSAIEIIDVGVLTYGNTQNIAYQAVFAEFERQHPKIKIRFRAISGTTYIDVLDNLLSMHTELDVINWYAGARLEFLVNIGVISPIDDTWQQQNLHNAFSKASTQSVRYHGHIYGVPLTSYLWGFYYKKTLFERLGLKPPTTWHELLSVFDILKQHKIAPIAMGTKSSGHATAWFDYLMLRLNGYHQYKQLMAGQLAYTSPEVVNVFKHWKELIDKDYFLAQHSFFDGQELMPLLYREVVGVNLIGSYSLNNISEKYQQEIDFFPFPQIVKQNHEKNKVRAEKNEISPIAVLSLVSSSKKISAAQELLEFVALPRSQAFLNRSLNTIAPHLHSLSDDKHVNQVVRNTLNNAEHLSQFFDRETDYKFARFAKKQLDNFIKHSDIEKVTQMLEAQRLTTFK